jgi:AP-4 complex subunit epsilon-1
MVLHRFYQLEASSISDQSDLLRRALCDRDPSVMGATLNILLAQMKVDPVPFKDLVPSFISILKQIIGRLGTVPLYCATLDLLRCCFP